MHKNVRFLDNSGTLCHNTSLIVSITKFSIVIGFPCAFCHVSRDHAGVQPFSNWIPRNSHVNYARFNGFVRIASCSFQNL